MKKLSLGKIPIETLTTSVLKLTGARSDRVLSPAKAGVDFAAVRADGKFIVISADPITGISDAIGTYALKIAANDVATSGNAPQFAESVIMLPEGSTASDLVRIARQIHQAAKDGGIAILGGHTEVTPGLRRPIVTVTVFSLVERFVTSADARAGDVILMTKTAGLEGTAELAREYDFPEGAVPDATLKKAVRYIEQIDITREARAAFSSGRVHAMHDCTEGGVLGAVFEMSLASGLGFALDEAAIPVSAETRNICGALSIDPLKLIGSGSLLIAVEKGREREVEKAVGPVCKITPIGEFTAQRRMILKKDGSTLPVKGAPQDELWRVLGRPSGRRRRI